jgi:hypothetical protein
MEPTALAHVLQMARAADPTITENKARSVLGALGRAVQVDPMKPMLKPPGTKHLRLN